LNKEVKKLVRTIEYIPGVEIRNGGKSHLHVYKEGKFVTTIASTPSDRRWRENTMASLRQAGITPATKPGGPAKLPEDILPVTKLRERVNAMPVRARFARFIHEEMPKLQPQLRTYKTFDSASASLDTFAHGKSGLSSWTHLLLDQAIREWDKLQHKQENGKQSEAAIVTPAIEEAAAGWEDRKLVESPITDEEIDEAIAIDKKREGEATDEPKEGVEVPPDGTEVELPELAGLSLTELGRDHEELTGRASKLAESVRSLQAQLDELLARREAISAEILNRISA
jgi:hypothetical protein